MANILDTRDGNKLLKIMKYFGYTLCPVHNDNASKKILDIK